MPAKFAITTAVAVPAVDGLFIVRATDVREDVATITLEIGVLAGEVQHPRTFWLTVTNGEADALVPNPFPTFQDVLLQEHRVAADHPELAQAWNAVMGAFQQGGTAGIMTALANMGLIPAGAVAA